MCGAFGGFSPPPPTPPISWRGCQVLASIGAVSMLELAANRGSTRMSQAPTHHVVGQLFLVTQYRHSCHVSQMVTRVLVKWNYYQLHVVRCVFISIYLFTLLHHCS